MKLYQIPRESKLKVSVTRPWGDGRVLVKDEIVTFHHLDGAYSYITTDDGDVLHLSASTPLRKEDDYYVIDERKETE